MAQSASMTTTPPASFPTVFYSWQSDLSSDVCRNFIQDCLTRAAKRVCKECELSMDPRVDRDTKDEPGSPDIVKIIERKIQLAKAFVGDVSLVAKNVDGRPKFLPNASVATETGFAVASLGERRVVLPFNEAFGDPDDLPFDLRNRRVLRYTLAPRSQAETQDEWEKRRAPVRQDLVDALFEALRAVFEKSDDPPPPTNHERMALLERLALPRSLSVGQKDTLIRHLARVKAPPGVKPVIAVSAQSFDSEAKRFADEIASVAASAGWKVVNNWTLLSNVLGLGLSVANPHLLPGEAIVFRDAFGEMGFRVQIFRHAELANQTGFNIDKHPEATVLLVGTKGP